MPESFRYRDQDGDVQIGRPPVLLLSVGGDSLSRIRTHPDRRNTSDRGVLLLAGVSNATTNNTGPSDLTLKESLPRSCRGLSQDGGGLGRVLNVCFTWSRRCDGMVARLIDSARS